MSCWYYTTGTEKALIIIGMIAIALLAIVIASPHVKFLQPMDKALGLMQVQTIYVPVNHTVYVNKTIIKYVYLNKTVTVPVYVNRIIVKYVPIYVNPLNTGTCNIYTWSYQMGRCGPWATGYQHHKHGTQ